MAEQDTLAPGAADDDTQQQVDTNQQHDDNDTQAADEGNGDDSPYAELATRMGWTPRDKFSGPADQWKPAEQFIIDGREIQRTQASELRTIRSQLDTISRTSASIVEQQVRERTNELSQRFNQAVEEGDGQTAFKISTELNSLRAPIEGAGPSPAAQSWAAENPWFQKEPLATALAMETCNRLAAAGYDHATQLQKATEEVKRQYPHLFGGGQQSFNGKPQAGVHTSSRGAGPRPKQETFEAMPKAAQDVANDMVTRGVIKDKDAYVKNYFANLKTKG